MPYLADVSEQGEYLLSTKALNQKFIALQYFYIVAAAAWGSIYMQIFNFWNSSAVFTANHNIPFLNIQFAAFEHGTINHKAKRCLENGDIVEQYILGTPSSDLMELWIPVE